MQCDWYIWYKISCIRAYPIMRLGYFSLQLFAKVKWNVSGEFSELQETAKCRFTSPSELSETSNSQVPQRDHCAHFVASSWVLWWNILSLKKTSIPRENASFILQEFITYHYYQRFYTTSFVLRVEWIVCWVSPAPDPVWEARTWIIALCLHKILGLEKNRATLKCLFHEPK